MFPPRRDWSSWKLWEEIHAFDDFADHILNGGPSEPGDRLGSAALNHQEKQWQKRKEIGGAVAWFQAMDHSRYTFADKRNIKKRLRTNQDKDVWQNTERCPLVIINPDLSSVLTMDDGFPFAKVNKVQMQHTIMVPKKISLYKTEQCRTYEETGFCRYGTKCQFAHSTEEMREIPRHPRYKTEICKTFWDFGTCPYGKRCCFIHLEAKDIVETGILGMNGEYLNEDLNSSKVFVAGNEERRPHNTPRTKIGINIQTGKQKESESEREISHNKRETKDTENAPDNSSIKGNRRKGTTSERGVFAKAEAERISIGIVSI